MKIKMKYIAGLMLLFSWTVFAIPDTSTEQYNSAMKAAFAYCGFDENYKPESFEGATYKDDDKVMQIAWDRFPSENYIRDHKIVPKGIIVLVSGKGESFARYAELFYDFRDSGYIFFALDNRGMGFSSRFDDATANRAYVDSFDNYVSDLKIFMDRIILPYAEKNRIPKIFTLSQSLGGCIVARFLEEYNKDPKLKNRNRYFDAAVFCCPMLDENNPLPGWTSSLLSKAHIYIFCGEKLAWGQDDRNTIITYAKKDKKNTSSADRYNSWEVTILGDKQYPGIFSRDIGIGGVTWKWLRESLKGASETRDSDNTKKIDIPVLLFQAGNDTYVSNEDENDFCYQSPKQRTLLVYPDSYHNILTENDSIRGAELSIPGNTAIDSSNTVIQNIYQFLNAN